MSFVTKSILQIASFAICLLILMGCDSGLPEITLDLTDDQFRFGALTLGEYPSHVTSISLYDLDTKTTVWRMKAKVASLKIGRLTVKIGENSTAQWATRFEVITPSGGTPFFVERGRKYRLTMVGGKRLSRSRSVEFQI